MNSNLSASISNAPQDIQTIKTESFSAEDYEDDIEMNFGGMRKIPEGIYIAECISHEGVKVNFGVPGYKIKYICKLITNDEYDGLLINIWRNVHGINGRKFMLSPLLKLTGELLLVGGPKARLDRMSVRWLYGKILQLEVTTVKKDKNGTLRHPEQHYSVVSSIKGVAL